MYMNELKDVCLRCLHESVCVCVWDVWCHRVDAVQIIDINLGTELDQPNLYGMTHPPPLPPPPPHAIRVIFSYPIEHSGKTFIGLWQDVLL